VDNAKLSQYQSGTQRKSRREKEQEAAETKKREEEVNQAKALSEFLDTFEGDGESKRTGASFVKADSRGSYSSLAGPSKPIPTGPSTTRSQPTIRVSHTVENEILLLISSQASLSRIQCI
jgi:hypothetical protein